jgi:hypothetical protein
MTQAIGESLVLGALARLEIKLSAEALSDLFGSFHLAAGAEAVMRELEIVRSHAPLDRSRRTADGRAEPAVRDEE